MVSPGSKRKVVAHLMSQGVSRKRACRLCGLSRRSSRTSPSLDRRQGLREKVLALAEQHPRYGFRQVHSLLCKAGDKVNLKAVRRIWREEGLALRYRKRRKLKVAKVVGLVAERPGEIWSMDFATDRLENGRKARILGVLDTCTRENLCLKARPSFPAHKLVEELRWLFRIHGKPVVFRSDNGPEFRSKNIAKFFAEQDVLHEFIVPGSPWQNGHIESFFGKLRNEDLDCRLYESGAELQQALNEFQEHYNGVRPHSALKGGSPLDFKNSFSTTNQTKEVAA